MFNYYVTQIIYVKKSIKINSKVLSIIPRKMAYKFDINKKGSGVLKTQRVDLEKNMIKIAMGIFILIIEKNLHQTVKEFVSKSICTFWHIDMPDETTSYGIQFDFITFFVHFHTLLLTAIHVWVVFSSTKLSQIVCLINIHILFCQCDCRIWKVLWFNAFFWAFSYYYTCLKRYKHQTFTNCV